MRRKQRGIFDGGLLSFAIPALLGILGNKGQEDTNDTNVMLNRENRDWMTTMSNTSYQRAIGDMQKAGLSPMLAYSQGGASVPSSQAPIVQSALGAGVSSAMQGMQGMSAVQQMVQSRAMTDNTMAQTRKVQSETLEHELNTAQRLAEIKKTQLEGRAKEEEVPGIWAASQRSKRMLEEETHAGEYPHSAFEADVRRRKAEATVRELDVPKAKAEAKFATDLEDMPKYFRLLLDILRGGASARSIVR